MITEAELLSDLAVFSDLGVSPPRAQSHDDGLIVAELTRNGDKLRIFFKTDGTVEIPESKRKFSTYRSLLASGLFADLREWAAVQTSVLRAEFRDEPHPIRVFGLLHSDSDEIDAIQTNRLLKKGPMARR